MKTIKKSPNGLVTTTKEYADKAKAQKIADDFVKALPETVTLWYLDRNDSFSEDTLYAMLKEDDPLQALEESTWEWYDDYTYDTSRQYIQDTVSKEEYELLEAYDMLQEVRCILQERNDAEPVKDILRNSPKLFTYYPILLKGEHVTTEGMCCEDYDETMDMLSRAIHGESFKKIDEKARNTIKELNDNASYGGLLCILDCEDASDVFKYPMPEKGATGKKKNVECRIAIIDNFNGSGHNVSAKAVNCTYELRPQGASYYANKVCGLCKW